MKEDQPRLRWSDKSLVALAVLVMFIVQLTVMAQVPGPVIIPPNIVNNSGLIPFDQGFFAFEVESPLDSLKGVPIWDELEQMLDDPYAFVLDPTVRGNAQGWPSYRLTQPRRRSFIYRDGAGQPCAPGSSGCGEVLLPGHLIHPLNYNHSTGEELRLLSIEFEGASVARFADQLLPNPVPGQGMHSPIATSSSLRARTT